MRSSPDKKHLQTKIGIDKDKAASKEIIDITDDDPKTPTRSTGFGELSLDLGSSSGKKRLRAEKEDNDDENDDDSEDGPTLSSSILCLQLIPQSLVNSFRLGVHSLSSSVTRQEARGQHASRRERLGSHQNSSVPIAPPSPKTLRGMSVQPGSTT